MMYRICINSKTPTVLSDPVKPDRLLYVWLLNIVKDGKNFAFEFSESYNLENNEVISEKVTLKINVFRLLNSRKVVHRKLQYPIFMSSSENCRIMSCSSWRRSRGCWMRMKRPSASDCMALPRRNRSTNPRAFWKQFFLQVNFPFSEL